jgi:hypothetical protein
VNERKRNPPLETMIGLLLVIGCIVALLNYFGIHGDLVEAGAIVATFACLVYAVKWRDHGR